MITRSKKPAIVMHKSFEAATEKLLLEFKSTVRHKDEFKKLIAGLQSDFDDKSLSIHHQYSVALRRIAKTLRTLKASTDITGQLTALAIAFEDHSNGLHVQIFAPIKRPSGRSKDATIIWVLRAQAALCHWLLEREHSPHDAAAIMTRECKALHRLKRNAKDDLHPAIIRWREQLEVSPVNPKASQTLKNAKARFQQKRNLLAAEATRIGLRRLGTLSKWISQHDHALRPDRV
jgi:hypothetical protein